MTVHGGTHHDGGTHVRVDAVLKKHASLYLELPFCPAHKAAHVVSCPPVACYPRHCFGILHTHMRAVLTKLALAVPWAPLYPAHGRACGRTSSTEYTVSTRMHPHRGRWRTCGASWMSSRPVCRGPPRPPRALVPTTASTRQTRRTRAVRPAVEGLGLWMGRGSCSRCGPCWIGSSSPGCVCV